MQDEYLKRIRFYLNNLKELQPISTNTETFIERDNSIKAVVFDIYGTLIISASGDIDKAKVSVSNLSEAIGEGGYSWCNTDFNSDGEQLLELFHQTVLEFHEDLKKQGHPYPEIDIIEVWSNCMNKAEENGWVKLSGNKNIKLLTVVFEVLGNHVYPMPNMNKSLQQLFQSKLPIGIVSNAQFYTPLIMNNFIEGEVSEIEHVKGFDEDISVYSYKLLRSKPDVTLFDKLAESFAKNYKLTPDQVLFVGNDMLKDVWTASQAGFKTALFTADERSLRLRESDDRCKGLKADYVIDDLMQIFDIVNH